MTYLARIAEVNPILHAVIETNPDALTIAASLDEQRKAGNVIGPLHGVPIIIKDNIATFDKMNTTAGSFSLLGAKVTQDSTMAAKLREAGVIILGKANLSQWANYRSSNSTNGWTSRGGQTTGAYYPMQDPSGSSSGSAVSSSIGLAMAALGSETSGSIISPSSRNSLAGVKPTVGLTSRFLVIPISSTQDTVGVSYLLVDQSSKLITLASLSHAPLKMLHIFSPQLLARILMTTILQLSHGRKFPSLRHFAKTTTAFEACGLVSLAMHLLKPRVMDQRLTHSMRVWQFLQLTVQK
jgi:Asp-tRNA(Asn)/Glu-tRNA(Gln) amidotransferase A subunit family amidase